MLKTITKQKAKELAERERKSTKLLYSLATPNFKLQIIKC